ncbi:MAG TPA: ATP-binding cassette domain-containing protein [Polyangia bacterium]
MNAPATEDPGALEVELQGSAGGLEIDVALRATAARPTVIAGPNGAGKTTLLLMILGAHRPRAGYVRRAGESLYDAKAGVDLPIERRRIGFLPQRYALFPHLDVRANVAYGIRASTRAERTRLADEALENLGIAALARRRCPDLSGGEAQRVALARALANRPATLLLDEPLAALDVAVRADTRTFVAERVRALGVPTIIVTHARADAAAFGGEIIVVEEGRVSQRGRLEDLAASPASAFVRRFTLDDALY